MCFCFINDAHQKGKSGNGSDNNRKVQVETGLAGLGRPFKTFISFLILQINNVINIVTIYKSYIVTKVVPTFVNIKIRTLGGFILL